MLYYVWQILEETVESLLLTVESGPPGEGPTCQATLYPEGSGACWRCNGQ
jgi:hypothetical protein